MSLFRGRLHLRPGASALSTRLFIKQQLFETRGPLNLSYKLIICLDILGLSGVRWIDEAIIDEEKDLGAEAKWGGIKVRLSCSLRAESITDFPAADPQTDVADPTLRASLVPNSFSGLGSASWNKSDCALLRRQSCQLLSGAATFPERRQVSFESPRQRLNQQERAYV